MIFQRRGAKAREQSDRAGGSCEEYGDVVHFVYEKQIKNCTLQKVMLLDIIEVRLRVVA